MKMVPISLVTGYLGSGKTTLINNILSNDKGYKIAVIVNDIGEVNLDAELIQKGGVVNLNNDSLVALQNGCICCNLNEDLIKQIINLCQSGKFDHIVIEASGICEPMPIVQSIVAIEEECHRRGIPQICKLDAVISVTDALRLVKEFGCGKDLQKKSVGDEDIESLIIQQLEFCDLILLNKVDEVSAEELKQVKAVIRQLQPNATIVETNYAKIDIEDVLDTNLFDFEKSFNGAGWLKAMDSHHEINGKEEAHREHSHHDHHGHHHDHHDHKDHHDHECHCAEGEECTCGDDCDCKEDCHCMEGGECTCGEECHCHENGEECHCHDEEHEHEHHHGKGCKCGHCHGDETTSEEYGISTFVYFRRRPMNRNKFLMWANHEFGREIIRTKGLVYFDDEKEMSYLFEQAGTQKNLTQSGLWYATAPKNELEIMLQSDPMLKRDWDEEYGDRMIKLVFIGQHMDKEHIIEILDNI